MAFSPGNFAVATDSVHDFVAQSELNLQPVGLFDRIVGVVEDETVNRVREGLSKKPSDKDEEKSTPTDNSDNAGRHSSSSQDNASNLKIVKEFFPSGKLATPRCPFIRYTFSDNADTIDIWYNLPREFINLAGAYDQARENDQSMKARFGVDDYTIILQTDAKIDNGSWQYTAEWDSPDWSGLDTPYYLAFDCNGKINNNEQAFYKHMKLSWLTYVENDAGRGFLAPLLYPLSNSDGRAVYHYDLNAHTLALRCRLGIQYEENGSTKCIFSDWSPVTSFGKEGTQKPIAEPSSIATPQLTEFSGHHYFINIDDSVFDGFLYCEGQKDMFEPYSIQSQIRVSGGEWQDIYTANPVWIFSGYRSLSEQELPDGNVELRVRLRCDNLGLVSDWSNVISKS